MGGEFSGVDEADNERSRKSEEFGDFLGCHLVVVGEDVYCASGREFGQELFDGATCWCWKVDLASRSSYREGSCVASVGEARGETFAITDAKFKFHAVDSVSNRSS